MTEPLRWLPGDYDLEVHSSFSRPLHMFIVKVATRCNLNCSYCYVYKGADQSWRSKPTFMSESTVLMLASRIQEHVAGHSLENVSIVFHGGEPTLAGVERLSMYIDILRNTINCKIDFGMQTNGTLMSLELIELLVKYQFRVGISLDGTKEHNDRNRVFHNGRSSYEDVVATIRGLRRNPSHRNLLGGVLVVIDVRNNPREILELIKSLEISGANLLLPDSNHVSKPYRPINDPLSYGKWLYEFFEIWIKEYKEIEIPYFEEIMNLMLGGVSGSEEIGAKSVDFIVIDTNGDIEAVDTLKMVGRQATSLGMNVKDDTFDKALKHPAIYSRMSGFESLCKKCRSCRFLQNCGGGYLPHRYSVENGFVNPSVYCEDLIHLFGRMQEFLFVPSASEKPLAGSQLPGV